MCFPVGFFEELCKSFEVFERRFSHELEDMFFGMLGCHFKSAAYMFEDEFSCVFVVEEVKPYAATHECFFDVWELVDGSVNVKNRTKISVEIFANGWLQAGGSFAFVANVFVFSFDSIHIGRWSSEVGDVSFEIG